MLTAAVICKNESKVIGRMLASIKGKVDMVFAIDTGSTDNTVEIIRNCGIPSIILHRPWKNFGHNRSELVREASRLPGYLLLIDCDHTLVGEIDQRKLVHPLYYMKFRMGETGEWVSWALIDTRYPWRFEGVTHEALVCDGQQIVPLGFPDAYQIEHGDSHRRSTNKFEDDIALLEQQLIERPHCTRTCFYLAQSYNDFARMNPTDPRAKLFREKAVFYYERRASMGGWDQEVYFSLMRIDTLDSHLRAIKVDPSRWESRYMAVHLLNSQRRYEEAYEIGYDAMERKCSPHGLFPDKAVYEYLLPFEMSVSCWYTGDRENFFKLTERLMRCPTISPTIRKQVELNLENAKGLIENVPA